MQQRNAGALRLRLENELKHAPQTEGATEDLYTVLSEEARTLAAEFDWPFLRRVAPVLVFPDITIPVEDVANTGYERLLFVEPDVFEDTLYPVEDANILHEFFARVPGATLDLADRTLRGESAANWSLAPFEVEFAQQADDGSSVQLWLDPRCKFGSSIGTDIGDLVLEFPRIRLPADVGKILHLRDPSRSGAPLRLSQVTGSHAEQAFRDLSPGDPLYFSVDPGGLSMAATAYQYVTPTSLIAMTGTSRTAVNTDALARSNLAPAGAPAFTAAARNDGSGALPVARYRVFVAWAYAGRVSPASATVEVRVNAATNSIRLSGLPYLAGVGGFAQTGRFLQVFLAKERGPFYLVGYTQPTSVSTYDILTLPTATTSPWGLVRWDDLYPGGPAVRLYPRPSTQRKLEVEYVVKLRDLATESDGWPFEVSQEWDDVVLWRSVARVLGRYQQAGVMAERIAADRLRALCRRYGMALTTRRIVRGGEGDEHPWHEHPLVVPPPMFDPPVDME